MSSPFHHTDDLNRRRRNQAKALPVWYICSMVLHVVLFGLLVWFTPLREIVIPQAKPEHKPSPMTPRQLQELADKIDELKQHDLLDNVQNIIADLNEFNEIRDQMAVNYIEYTEHVADSAAEAIDKLLAELEVQQDLALQAMDAVDPELAKTDAIQDPVDQREQFNKTAETAEQLQNNVIKEQIPPLDTIDKALSIAQMAGMTETADAIKELLNNQNIAHELQTDAAKTNSVTREALNRAASQQQELKKEQQALERAENRLNELQKQNTAHTERLEQTNREIETATTNQADANAKLQQAQQNRDDVTAKEKPTEQEKKQAENLVKNAETALQRVDQQIANLEKRRDDQQAAVKRAEEQLQQQTEVLQTAQQKIETRKEAIDQATQAVAQLQTTMTPAQNEAKKTQLAARQLREKARELAKTETPKPELNSELFASEPPVDYNKLYQMDVVDLYNTALQLENKVLESYRDVRATERAILANMSVENARKLTDVATTMRPAIDEKLLRSEVRTTENLDKHKEAVADAIRETSGIHQSVSALLDTVRQVAHANEGFSVDFALEMAHEQEQNTEAVTAETELDDTADISELMKNAMLGNHNLPHTASSASAKPQVAGNLPHAAPNAPRGSGVPRGINAFHTSSDPRSGAPEQISGGRTIGPGGVTASWLALTTWYIIGPFPNPARANIDRKFPPRNRRRPRRHLHR